MGELACKDFKEQKSIADLLNYGPTLLGKILLNLGMSYILCRNRFEAEKFIRRGLTYFDGSLNEKIFYRKKLYEAITLDGFGNVRATVGERILEEIHEIASEENNYEEMQYAVEKLIQLYTYFDMVDSVRVQEARLDRINALLNYSEPSQYSDNVA